MKVGPIVGCYEQNVIQHAVVYLCSYIIGELDILKLLIKKCGKQMAEKQDSRQTKPVYFASQEGTGI